MNKFAAMLAWLALVLLSAATFVVLGSGGADKNAPPVAAAPISTTVETNSLVEATGRVVPAQSVELRFPTKGTTSENIVAEVLVQEGDVVTKGALLARVDTRDLQLRVEEAQAALAQAQANYNKLRAEADATRLRAEAEIASLQAEIDTTKLRAAADAAKLQSDANVARLLSRPQAAAALDASMENTLQAANALEISNKAKQEKLSAALTAGSAASAADIAGAEAQIKQSEIALKREELALEIGTLRSPIDGTIVQVDLVAGEVPSATEPAIIVADFSRWQIQATELTDLNIVRIREGDSATLAFEALPGLQLPGKVTRIKVNDTTGVTGAANTYTVIIVPDQQDERIRANMMASVVIAAGDGQMPPTEPAVTPAP